MPQSVACAGVAPRAIAAMLSMVRKASSSAANCDK